MKKYLGLLVILVALVLGSCDLFGVSSGTSTITVINNSDKAPITIGLSLINKSSPTFAVGMLQSINSTKTNKNDSKAFFNVDNGFYYVYIWTGTPTSGSTPDLLQDPPIRVNGNSTWTITTESGSYVISGTIKF